MGDSRPKMRGLLAAQIKRNLIGACTSGIVAGLLFNTYYIKPRHKRIRDYYRDFDAEASLENMKDYLQSTGGTKV